MDELINGGLYSNETFSINVDCNNNVNNIILNNNKYNSYRLPVNDNYFEFNYASHPYDAFMETYDDDDEEQEEEEEEEAEVEQEEKEECNTDDAVSLSATTEREQDEQEQQQQQEEEERAKEEKEKEEVVKRKNLIIWDWDDTLFPTYSFRTHQDKKDKDFMSKLSILVFYIEKIFISQIELYGSSNIIIITNASDSWINKCLNVDIVQNTFWNFQQNILKKYNIKTISASTRDITSKYPKNHYKWKEIVFQRVFDKYFDDENNDNLINCITSIGDSLCEYNASHTASKYIKNRILNRIRLKSNPSINDMIIQLKQILNINKQFGLNINDINMDYCSLLSSSSISSLSMSCSDTTC